MADRPCLIDIHCHLLPELDDGARNWDEALAMAKMAVADGVTTVVVTPHQLGAFSENRGESIRARTLQLQQLLDRQGVALQVLPGAEVRIEPGLIPKIEAGDILTLAGRRRHVLLELPHDVYIPLERFVAELSSAGLVPVLAHPERNAGILARPEVLSPLLSNGCLLQITAGSLLGAFGPATQALAQRLISQGMAHFLATDAHGTKTRRPLLSRALEWVSKTLGSQLALDLCCRNPACVIAGRDITAPHQGAVKSHGRGWLWRRGG
jgi:protein-tyrosine phosphatase